MNTNQPEIPRANNQVVNHVIILVHGIRSFGNWQEQLEGLIRNKNDQIKVLTYKYGYFGSFEFLIPFRRTIIIRRFERYLSAISEKYKNARVDIVAHSFGTFVTASSIKGLSNKKDFHINTVILCGSVLKQFFPWNVIVGENLPVKRVVNECGTVDVWPLIAQFFVFGMGAAGRRGFAGGVGNDAGVINRQHKGVNHGGFFDIEFMKKHWLPLFFRDDYLTGESLETHWSAALEQYTDPIKMIFLILPLFIGFSIFQQRNAARELQRVESGLRLTSDAYKVLYRDPAQAIINAYDASKINPSDQADEALKEGYKVALFQYYNRLETSRMTGSGPGYLAYRWKQSQVFSEFSSDGRYQLIVTERGEDGANPPGAVYLLNNDNLKLTKLEDPDKNVNNRRVEDVGFSFTNDLIFVVRQFYLSVFSLTGEKIGEHNLSRYTKSPAHIAEGKLWDKYVICGETKGGLYLVDPDKPEVNAIKLKGEWSKDAAVSFSFSHNGKFAAIILESGRAALVSKDSTDEIHLNTLVEESVLFATFDPTDENLLVTSTTKGMIQVWNVEDTILMINEFEVDDDAIPWVSFAEDGKRIVAMSASHTLHIADDSTGQIITSINYSKDIDWGGPRTVPVNRERSKPFTIEASKRLAIDDPELKIGNSFEFKGNFWLSGSYNFDSDSISGILKLRGDSLDLYSCQLPANYRIDSLEKGFLWFKNSYSYGPEYGPVFQLKNDEIIQFPEKNKNVYSALYTDSSLWLGTWTGLFEIREDEIIRQTNEDQQVKIMKEIDNRIIIGTNRGTFVVEDNRLVRLTDRTYEIREIKEAGGHAWILTGSLGMLGTPGPAYRISGYFGIPEPDARAKVRFVSEDSNRVIIVTTEGRYQWTEASVNRVGDVENQFTFPVIGHSIKTTKGEWIFYQSLRTLERVAQVMTPDTIEMEMDAVFINETEIIRDTIWIATNRGLYQIVDSLPRKIPEIQSNVEHIVPIGEDIWFLSDSESYRWSSMAISSYPTDGLQALSIKQVDNDLWLLTAKNTTNNFSFGVDPVPYYPAYRIEGGKAVPYGQPGKKVIDVILLNEKIWLITEEKGVPGPMIPVDAI